MNKTRKHGLVLLGVGAIVFCALALIAIFMSEWGWNIHGFAWGIPGAFALVGLIEVVSGIPFRELSGRWDSLAGWQRGILGVLIVVASLIPIALACWVAVWFIYM